MMGRGFLATGYNRVFDCIGSRESLDDALRVTAPGGTIVLVGAAGVVPNIDLTTVWTREQKLEGTVYYGFEEWRGERAPARSRSRSSSWPGPSSRSARWSRTASRSTRTRTRSA